MDNLELDEILKEKLNGKIKPSKEFEEKIIKKVELEKMKMMTNNNQQESEKTINNSNQQQFTKLNNTKKPKKHKNFAKLLSMAAIVVVVFTLGMNLKTAPILKNVTVSSANLTSIRAIEPTKLESGVLAKDSEFTIYAEGENLNTETIQKSIYVEPALEYTIEKTLNRNEYKLKFKQNIPDNTIVKLQYVKNQVTEDSWAYQTSNKFSITSTYPDNNTEALSKKSVIDVEFSYASVEDFEKYVKITPSVKGKWEHLAKIWRFTPSNQLKEDTKYTVTISKQVTADGQKLGDDYKFSFTVRKEEESTYTDYNGISIDKISTSKPNEKLKIQYYTSAEAADFGKVELDKFANIEDFINYVKDGDLQKAVKQKEYEIEHNEKYIEFKEFIPKGFYVAKIKNKKGKELFNCPVQISETSAYAMETEKDVLIWVAKGNDLVSNINVEYLGKNIKTDKQGIAKFENISDGSKKIKYAKVANDLVIGVYNFDSNSYPLAYIYTDRPLYKNTDTINVWGFVPKKIFNTPVEDEFYIQLNEEGKQKISVAEDGNFTYKFDLYKHTDLDNATISLYYKDTSIANRYITIKNYELQNYTYEVSTNKNYGFKGQNIEFDVKVKHITGLIVPNKNVIAKYEDKIFRAKTGEDGVAHFKIKIIGEDSEQTEPRYQGINIYNGDEIEYTDAETYIDTYLLTRNVYTKHDYESEDKYRVNLYKLDTKKNANAKYELEELYNGVYETQVDINVIEEVRTAVQNGEDFNEYTKKMEPHFDYVTTENKTKLKTVKSTSGLIEVADNEIEKKEDTENVSYSYTLELIYKDLDGRRVRETMPIYKNWYNREEFGYFAASELHESDSRVSEIPAANFGDAYNTYRYFWDCDEYAKYTSGKKINFKLLEATQAGNKNIENKGKILNIFFKENITETSMLTENNFGREFSNEDFPGFKMASAYFVNGRFYRMPTEYFDFDEDSKKVDIQINADKEQYRPGDEVTLNIKTTKNGKGVKSFVNVSVANEAVFEIEEDITNILETIYKDKSIAVYTYSSFLDDITSAGGGEGGGDGVPRGNFGDTAHFETVYTDKSGNAKVKFKLPDNVTTYRVTAHSANEDMDIGVNTKQITSKLDFFVQSVEPRGIKTTDDVVLNATSIADNKYDVNYEFTIKEINKTLTAKGKTNGLTTVNFGKLPYGTYTVIVKGTHETEQDAIEYKFNVVKATQEVKHKTTMNISSESKIKPTRNPIVLEVYNRNISKYVEYIDFIESTVNERLDTQIAYNAVQTIKDKYYETNTNTINSINMSLYQGDSYYLKYLRNSKENIILTALITYYANQYLQNDILGKLDKNDNVFEYYLLLAARHEPVLQDLKYLKEEKDIANYNKLILTLAFEFAGDYKNAKELYNSISLKEADSNEYKSLIALIETFINKKQATSKIDELIKNKPADEILRFAILSYFNNNSSVIEKEDTVRIKAGEEEKTLKLNGMQVKTLTLNNEQLKDLSFDTSSNDIMVSYYYQTELENIESKNIKKDIKIAGQGKLSVGNTVNIKIDFTGNYEGEVRIALPNCLRLSKVDREIRENATYYIQNNHIDYITIYKTKKCKTIYLPLVVINKGSYKFENIVCQADGIYHISNSINLNIK